MEVLGLVRVHLPNIRSARTSEKPRIAFRGVRSSWDMLARNSLLWRLATSSPPCRRGGGVNDQVFILGGRESVSRRVETLGAPFNTSSAPCHKTTRCHEWG